MKRNLILMIVLLSIISCYATTYTFTKGSLKFIADPNSKTATLVANKYSGDITVSSKYSDNNIEFTVNAFADNCFKGCSGLTSINIPSTVKSLGLSCFAGCSGLKSITIPSSVTSMDDNCFEDCYRLTNISLQSTIKNLSNYCFKNCNQLKSITIPTSVSKIGNGCFKDCSSLKQISIPNSVSSLSTECFSGCTGLISIEIPNCVTTLGDFCFEGCYCLKEITIPSSITSVGGYCFAHCNKLNTITCEAENPPSAYEAFDSFDTNNCTLYVPSVEYYRNADGWKLFKKIHDLSWKPTEKKPCEKPTISFSNGSVHFSDATANVKFHYSVTSPDIKADSLNENGDITLAAYYDISVYATADGYKASDKATARLYWVKANGTLDTATNIAAKSMRGIVVSADDGFINVSGLSENESVSFYTIDGKILGQMRARNGIASLATSESVVLCKVGDKTIKVSVR